MNRRQYDKLISLKIGNKRATRSGEFEVEIENGVYNVVSVLMAGIPREECHRATERGTTDMKTLVDTMLSTSLSIGVQFL